MFSSFASQEQSESRVKVTVMLKLTYNRCNFSNAAQTIEQNGIALKNPVLTITGRFWMWSQVIQLQWDLQFYIVSLNAFNGTAV